MNVIRLSSSAWRSINPIYSVSRCAATAAAPKRQGLKDVNKVPGPFNLPILGTTPAVIMNRKFEFTRLHKYMQYAEEKYGSIFRMDMFGVKAVCISDPDDIQKVFESTKDNPARNGFESMKKVRQETIDGYFENKFGVLIEDGEEWWRVRRRTQGPMMKPKIVKSYLDSHNEVALEFLNTIADFQKKYGEMPANFQEEIYKWALESVALVALDRKLGCLQENLPEDSVPMKMINNANLMFESLVKTEFGLRFWKYFETKPYKELKSATTLFTEVADANIRQTVEELKTKSEDVEVTLMESLLQMPGLSYKDVVTMVLDMLFAGIDTTSHTIGFVLYLLAKNPEKQKKLQQEIDEIFGDRQDFTTADFAKLSYVKNVVKEALRLFPIAPGVIRILQEDLELQGYLVPKGYGAMSMTMLSSRKDKHFPRAMEFIPERWNRDRPLGAINPFTTLPFGHGTRMCIGRRIAEQEMYVFLTRVLQRFNVDYKYKDMDIKTSLVFHPSEPLMFNFTERK